MVRVLLVGSSGGLRRARREPGGEVDLGEEDAGEDLAAVAGVGVGVGVVGTVEADGGDAAQGDTGGEAAARGR